MSELTTDILPDDKMRELGFTDRRPGEWYLCRRVFPDVTLNVTINKGTGAYEEIVIDEPFGQPFYYGWASERVRDEVMQAIGIELEKLIDAGLSIWINHADYGVSEAEARRHG